METSTLFCFCALVNLLSVFFVEAVAFLRLYDLEADYLNARDACNSLNNIHNIRIAFLLLETILFALSGQRLFCLFALTGLAYCCWRSVKVKVGDSGVFEATTIRQKAVYDLEWKRNLAVIIVRSVLIFEQLYLITESLD